MCSADASYQLPAAQGIPQPKRTSVKIIKCEYVTAPLRKLETWNEPYLKSTWGDRKNLLVEEKLLGH